VTTTNGFLVDPLNHPLVRRVAVVWGLIGAGYHLYLVSSGLLPNLITRPLHLLLALPWVFLFATTTSRTARWSGWIAAAIGMAGSLWVALDRDTLVDQYGALNGPLQTVISIALILVVLEMGRRAIKWILPAVALVALAYGLFGNLLPGRFGHPGFPLESFLGTLTIAEGGLWGPLTGISVDVVAVFVLLGAVIGAGEAGQAFMAIATWSAGGLRAGAAKVAVVASALFGSISGSASANVASTGAITLPTMKRLGYPASLAAAVEAVASTGGQIMPPLMGAGAFVMAELLTRPYTDIVVAATLPAILFFAAVWIGVDRQAARAGLAPMPADERPTGRTVLRLLPFFALPFGVLLAVLFGSGRTPQLAAGAAIATAVVLLLVDERLRPVPRLFVNRIARAAIDAGRQTAGIAAIIVCAGLIVGVLNQTGLGVKVTSAMIALSGGQLWAALLLTALACLILGMEVPTTAAYVICVAVAGPALIELGLPPLVAHLFVFWYALLSTITPPVCGTVFIAAGMADAPWLAVAGRALKLGLGLYLVPIAFVVQPALLDPLGQPFEATVAFLRIGAALWLVSAALAGGEDALARSWLRLTLLISGLALLLVRLV
jgi:TRAP transporter 4TM/12TM fusion protein